MSTEEISQLLGISTRTVRTLVKQGKMPVLSEKPYKFDAPEAIQAYLDYKIKMASPKATILDDKRASSEKLRAEADNKIYMARMSKIRLEELEGKMHDSEDVEAITNELVYTVRSNILALPGRLAMDLAQINSASEVSARIQKECYAILNELADFEYDPEKYKKRLREKKGWIDGQEEGEE